MKHAFYTIVLGALCATIASLLGCAPKDAESDRLNLLFITVDDMNRDSVGIYGSKVKNITPNIDNLAAEGMRFDHGHVTVSICKPTRAVWMTGRYPHRSGALGFEPIRSDVPTLVEALRDGGYYTGIMGKQNHVVPTRPTAWDVIARGGKDLKNGRDPASYYKAMKTFVAKAKKNGKPFFMMANTQDPHRPFPGSAAEQIAKSKDQTNPNPQYGGGFPAVSRRFEPGEIDVPGFLPDLPDVRKELAQYFTSVYRADQVVGAVLRALDEAGVAENTLVIFKSDNGMPFPFGKTNVWNASTRTPWIVRWPGVTTAGVLDSRHVVSGIDVAPTFLDAAGLPRLAGTDGRSIVPILKGGKHAGWERAFTHVNSTFSGASYPMRSVIDARFGYIYNAWSNGKTRFQNESQQGLTMPAMNKAARTDRQIADRVRHFIYRETEELYDYQSDPDALHNLIDDPSYADALGRYRRFMQAHLASTRDPLLSAFERDVKPHKD